MAENGICVPPPVKRHCAGATGAAPSCLHVHGRGGGALQGGFPAVKVLAQDLPVAVQTGALRAVELVQVRTLVAPYDDGARNSTALCGAV